MDDLVLLPLECLGVALEFPYLFLSRSFPSLILMTTKHHGQVIESYIFINGTI